MRKKYLNLREMLRRFTDFTEAYQVKLDAIPVVKELITLILNQYLAFETMWAIREKDYKGTTLSKKDKKNAVAEQLGRVNQLIYNYCIKNNELEDLPNFKGSGITYAQYGDERLISRLELTKTYCVGLGEKLVDTGVSEEMLSTLQTRSESYIELVPRPKELQNTSKIAGNELSSLSYKMINAFRFRLDKVMKSMYERDEPELYKAYLAARDIEKVGHKKIAVSGLIIDKLTKEPVPQAQILIPDAQINHQCTGKKGGFRIKSLQPGSYDMIVKAVTYKSIKLQVIHRYGETNVFELEMETEESH